MYVCENCFSIIIDEVKESEAIGVTSRKVQDGDCTLTGYKGESEAPVCAICEKEATMKVDFDNASGSYPASTEIENNISIARYKLHFWETILASTKESEDEQPDPMSDPLFRRKVKAEKELVSGKAPTTEKVRRLNRKVNHK